MPQLKTKRFIRLIDDRLFKETFGNPKNMKYLEDLLESYMKLDRYALKGKLKVCYESNILKTIYGEKANRGDLIVTVDNDIIINIEMYSIFNDEAFLKSRFYYMKIYTLQLKSGDDYKSIKKVNQINFMDKVRTINHKIENKIESVIEYGDKDSKAIFYRLDLLPKKSYNDDRFTRWLYFIASKTKEERDKIALGDEMFMDLNKWLEEYSNDETLNEYFDDVYWDRRIQREEGRKEGIIKTARNLKKSGIPLNVISENTELSIEEIEAL